MKLIFGIFMVIFVVNVGVSSLKRAQFCSPDESPFLATIHLILSRYTDQTYALNGVIISDRFVLTARHRIRQIEMGNSNNPIVMVKVFAGGEHWSAMFLNGGADDLFLQERQSQSAIHYLDGFEEVELYERSAYLNNIVILQLTQPFQFSNANVGAIPIRLNPVQSCLRTTTYSWRLDWDADHDRGKLASVVLGPAACADLNLQLLENELCAQHWTFRARMTDDDIGSPVVVDGMLVGIVVDTLPANQFGLWILLKIQPYIQFIQRIMEENQ